MIKVMASSLRSPAWTVGIVNWKSIDYLSGQLRQLYELNDPKCFTLHVFDATFPRNQVGEILRIAEPYVGNGNMTITAWERRSEMGRPHGAELDQIAKSCDSELFLSNDPDFLWAVGNHLGFLGDILRSSRSAGARHNISHGHLAPWCAAYRTDDIRSCSWQPRHGRDRENRVVVLEGRDTGWMPSEATQGLPRCVFEPCDHRPPFLGPVSYCWDQQHSTSYAHEGRLVGTHMFRGRYILEPSWKPTPEEWRLGRKAHADHFFDIAKANIHG